MADRKPGMAERKLEQAGRSREWRKKMEAKGRNGGTGKDGGQKGATKEEDDELNGEKNR